MELTVVIPVYNSQDTIGPLVERVTEVLRMVQHEIILVNDGSRDGSEVVCETLTRRFETVNLLSLRRNFGEFNAVFCGLRHASGRFVVMIDDDFQNPPEEILKLYHAAETGGYDVVYSVYPRKRHNWVRNLGSWLANYLAIWLFDKPKNLYLSSFKLIRHEVVGEITQYRGPQPYLDALLLRVTQNIGQVEVAHLPRQRGKSGYTTGKLISLFLAVALNYSPRPLRLISVIGLILLGLSLAVGIIELLTSVLTQHWPDVSHLTWILDLFRTGLELLGIGLLGEYIGRAFILQSGFPQYVVKKAILKHDRTEQ
ncbi:MAG: glycosyltransferase family 2 protein [Cytophagaceae bacterium]|nr:glycosyltransferase family 2 protein [Cytophagaceae bacterium]